MTIFGIRIFKIGGIVPDQLGGRPLILGPLWQK